MCGICGIFNYRLEEAVDSKAVTKMCRVLKHRGPDDEGYYVYNRIGLGHCRLAIIDLTGGRQPISNEDKTIWIIVNGEIYNYKSIREELLKQGHKFSTKSDSEVIVHLYEEFGQGFIEKIRGMFAIALWDERRGKLILARDRLGIKPLFYYFDNQKLLFSSEIKSILQYQQIARRVNYEALHNYLSFMTTSGVKTIFDGIYRLLPAQILICTAEKIEKKIYWQLPQSTTETKSLFKDFYDILIEVIKLHLVSDVPVGAFLSGGLDSSTVVALMRKVMNQPIKTFSIGFSGKGYYNELPFAREIARHFGTEHHEFIVTPNLVEALPEITEYFSEPFAVSSALPTYFLAKLAREKVKVVLTGDGADELMAGYHYRYLGIHLSRYFDKVPFTKKMRLDVLLSLFMKAKKPKIDKFFAHLNWPSEHRYFRYLTKFQEEQKFRLYSKDLKQIASCFDSSREFSQYYHKCCGKDTLNKWMQVDLKTSLPDEMLTKVDSMTMAHGLEARVPFLDSVLVEYLCSLPSAFKLRYFTSKYILKRAMAQLLPKKSIKRRKHGFEVPVDDWIRTDLKNYVREYLNENRIKKEGFFDWRQVRQLLTNHLEHKGNFGHQIWALLNFEIWYEKYMQ